MQSHRVIMLVALLGACLHAGQEKNNAPPGSAAKGARPDPGAPAQLLVHLRNPAGQAIADGLVQIDKREGRSGPDGTARFAGIRAGSYLVRTRASAYAPGFQRFQIRGGESLYLRLTLLNSARIQVDRLDTAQKLKLDRMELSLPARALVDAKGRVATAAELEYALLDPRTDAARSMPGNYEALGKDGSMIPLESIGAASLEFRDRDSGEKLNVAPGKTLSLSLPVFGKAADRSPPIWSLDEARGVWVEEGQGRIETQGGVERIVLNLPHLSWWNCDYPMVSQAVWIQSFENEDGRMLFTPQTSAKGLDYNGISSPVSVPRLTGSCVNVKPNAKIELSAEFYDGTGYYDFKETIQSGSAGSMCQNNPEEGQLIPKMVLRRIKTTCIRGKIDLINGPALSELLAVKFQWASGPMPDLPGAAVRVGKDGSFCIGNVPLKTGSYLQVQGPPQRSPEGCDFESVAKFPLPVREGADGASCDSPAAMRGCIDVGSLRGELGVKSCLPGQNAPADFPAVLPGGILNQ